MNDWDLLNEYALRGSQEAFATLVSRNLNLVYSAARRQISSPQLAEEIVQSVFLDLARQAGELRSDSTLGSWLYLVTRRTALNVARAETRRRAREHAAFELTAMNATPSTWPQIEPILDEAVAALPESDRAAILLRYFANKSLREVGEALGSSEDAAQKRVSRALDQLRGFFLKRGIAVSAVGLATDLSAHAVQIAPAALGTTVSAGAALSFSTGVGAAAIETVRATAMTTLQKTAFAAAVTLVAGTGLYEARALQRQSGELGNEREQVARLEAESATLMAQRSDLVRQAAAAREASRLSGLASGAIAGLDPTIAAELEAWLMRVDKFKESFANDPAAWIPEMASIPDSQWIVQAKNLKTSDPDDMRRLRSIIRGNAVNIAFSGPLYRAYTAYRKAHGDAPPTNMGELQPYFEPPIDSAILDRYEVISAEQANDSSPPWGRITGTAIREKTRPDLEIDSLFLFSSTGVGAVPALPLFARKAIESYIQANGGQRPSTPDQLLPFLPQPVNPEKLQRFLK